MKERVLIVSFALVIGLLIGACAPKSTPTPTVTVTLTPKEIATLMPTIESLIKALGDENEQVRLGARKTLAEIGQPAVEPLIESLRWRKYEDLKVAQAAFWTLIEIGQPAIESLIRVLEDEESQIRLDATTALGKIGDPRAVDPLIKVLLEEEKEYVREHAAEALSEIGDPRAVEPLIKALLEDEELPVRAKAASALGEIGDRRAVPFLKNLLTEEELRLKVSVLQALVKLGEANLREESIYYSELYELIQKSRSYNDSFACSDADYRLGGIGGKYAVDALILNLHLNYWQAPGDAAIALAETGDPRAFDALIYALNYPSRAYTWCISLHEGIAVAFGELGDRRAVEPLIKILEDKEKYSEDVGTRAAAASSLGKLGDLRAVEPLIGASSDENVRVRVCAAEALGEIGDARAIEPLNKLLEDEDFYVRRAAQEALKKIR